MTDQQMHERLVAAGNRWREAQPTDVPAPRILPRQSSVRRPAAWALSAAAVAAAVVALVVGLTSREGVTPNPTPPGDPASIEGIRWVDPGFTYIWPPGVHPFPHGYDYSYKRAKYLRITANGRVTGFDGCDAVSGYVRITPRYLFFGQLTKTVIRPCARPGPAHDAFMVDTFLTGRVHWQLVCGHLTLTKPQRGENDWRNSRKPTTSGYIRCMRRWSRARS